MDQPASSCQRPDSFCGQTGVATRRGARNTLTVRDLDGHACTRIRAGAAHSTPRCRLSGMSATVRVPAWVPHAGCRLCLSRMSLRIRGCQESAVSTAAGGQSTARERGASPSSRKCPLSPGSKPPELPSGRQESHSQRARARSVFQECRCYAVNLYSFHSTLSDPGTFLQSAVSPTHG